MTPHPSLLDKIDRGKVAVHYTISNLHLIRSKGVDKTTSSPKLQTLQKQNIFLRSLEVEATPRGSRKALAILVKFSDKASQVEADYFVNLLFGQSTETLRDYYDKVRYGNLDIIAVNLPSVVGCVTAQQTYAYYVNVQNGTGGYPQNSQKLVWDVVNLVNPQVDFSRYYNHSTFEYSEVVEVEVELPKDYTISQNYSNPFNPTTRIDYQLPFDSKLTI